MCAEHAHPLIIQQTFQALRRNDTFKEKRREDRRDEGLQCLENHRDELVNAAGGGVRAFEQGWVDIGVEEAHDREDGREDGYGGGDGKGESCAVEVNDAAKCQSMREGILGKDAHTKRRRTVQR